MFRTILTSDGSSIIKSITCFAALFIMNAYCLSKPSSLIGKCYGISECLHVENSLRFLISSMVSITRTLLALSEKL